MTRLALALCLLACAFAQTPDLLERADEAFRQGDLDHAASLAQQVIARNPSAVHAHLIAGVVAAQKNQWSVSDRHFQTVVRLEPANPYGYFYLGQAKLYQQQWEPAIRFFTKALEHQYPDRGRVIIEMALAQNETGRSQQALENLAKLTPPDDPRLAAQYYSVTAFARANTNEPGPAIEAIRHALELDDSIPQSWTFLIGTLLKMDEAPRALAEAIRAQKKFPDDADVQYLFALASYYVSESPLSRLALRNLRDADPKDPRVLLAEGLLHRKQGRNEEATSSFRQAVQRGVDDAHLLLGIVYRENGDIAAAKTELEQAERLNPRNPQAALEMGRVLLSEGQLDAAKTRLEKAVLALPENPTAHYQLGLLYRKLNQPEKAEEHFRKSRDLAVQAR
jgi:tetratricopeptide (TPR) repeat protein